MSFKLDRAQHREFRKMLLTIKTNSQQTGLLIAVCDDRNFQVQLIDAYEAELEEAEVMPFRVRLNPKQPSVREALQQLVDTHPKLAEGGAAVATVVNANELLGVRLTEEKSEQEKFFFSLQWTREALLRFKFPIVIWLTDQVATRLSRQAPDFWSWRTGVFEFTAPGPTLTPSPYQGEGWSGVDAESHATSLAPFSDPDFTPLSPPLVRGVTGGGGDGEATGRLSVVDVQAQITALETTAREQGTADSPLLVTLYNELGDAHKRDYKYKLALEAYEKAVELARVKEDKGGEARSLFNIAYALQLADRPSQAIPYYEQAIELYRELGDLQGESIALINLGSAYFFLGQYPQVIDFSQQSLEIFREIGDRVGEAQTLNCLGLVYDELEQYPQAIGFHQQSLEIGREIGDRYRESYSLDNLGLAYSQLGQYPQAIDFHQQSLKIACEIGDRHGEARSLCNLGIVYKKLGQHSQAIDFYQQALEINRKIGDRYGESANLSNLGKAHKALGQYQQAIKLYRQAIPIMQEIENRHHEANSLYSLGYALARVDQKWEAKTTFEQARTLYEAMGLKKWVKECDAAIRDLGQEVVVIPKKTPIIGEETPQVPDWWEKSLPSVESSGDSRPWKMPLWGWFILGLVVVAIIWRVGF